MSGATVDPRLSSEVAVHSALEVLCHIWISQGCTGNEVLDSSTTVKLIYRDQLSFDSVMEDGCYYLPYQVPWIPSSWTPFGDMLFDPREDSTLLEQANSSVPDEWILSGTSWCSCDRVRRSAKSIYVLCWLASGLIAGVIDRNWMWKSRVGRENWNHINLDWRMEKAGVVAVMMMKEVEAQDEVAMRGGETFLVLDWLAGWPCWHCINSQQAVDQLDLNFRFHGR